MNKSFIFSVMFLGLMVGSVECSERNSLDVHPTDVITNVVISGWLAKSIVERRICGSWGDMVGTLVPLILVSDEIQNNKVPLSAVLAGLNVARITYHLLKRQQTLKGQPTLKNVASQTDAHVVWDRWHSKDTRKYELSTLPMFTPQTKAT